MSISRGPKIIKDNLVLYLDAADKNSYVSGSSTWYDLSGNNNTGTLTNGPVFNSTNQGSIVFDGTNDYVNCGSSSALQPSSISVCVWLKLSVPLPSQSVTYPLIIDKYDLNSKNGYNLMFDRANDKVQWRIFNGSTDFSILLSSANSLIGTSWKHIVGTFNGSVLNLYLNGQTGSTPITASTSISYGNETLYLGAYKGAAHFIAGTISNVQIYNRALTAAEILQNYTAVKGRFGL